MGAVSYTPESFECLFDDFVRVRLGGGRLDEMLGSKLPPNTKCADYFFPGDGIIAELKTLQQNHGDKQFLLKVVIATAVRLGHPYSVVEEWLDGSSQLPWDIEVAVHAKVQNSLKKAVRKANEQVKSARTILKKRHDSILIVANLGERLFGPIELLRNLAGHALGRTALSIDAILLLSPGVAYSSGRSMPQHYVAPVYAEGKTYLCNFVEPLVEQWIEFESVFMGLKPEIEKKYELDEESMSARPVK